MDRRKEDFGKIWGEKHRKRNENPSGREEQLKRGKKKKEGKWREREGGKKGGMVERMKDECRDGLLSWGKER